MFPSATFKATYPEPGTFAVAVGSVAKAGGNLTVLLDGNTAAQKSFAAGDKDHAVGETVEVKVPSGEHSLRIENSGADWITIRRITFAPLGPALGIMGKSARDYAVFWLTNRLASRPDGVKGKLTIPGLAAGSYKVTWWDTTTGKPTGDSSATATAGALTVDTPAIVHDVAVTVATSSVEKAVKAAAQPTKRGKNSG
jgi:hypothetical protein